MSERNQGRSDHFLPRPLRRVAYPVLGIIDSTFGLSAGHPERAIAAERARADEMVAVIDELTDRIPPANAIALPPAVLSVEISPAEEC